MGNILNVLKTCGSGYPDIEEDFLIFLDFEGIKYDQLRDAEMMDTSEGTDPLESQVAHFLENAEKVLDFMRNYQSSGNKVIQQVTSETEVLEILKIRIFELQRALELSEEIERLVPTLLDKLLKVDKRLSENNAHLLHLGRILDSAMQFDEMKLAAPGLQNDISYAKRQLVMREEFVRTFGNLTLDNVALFYIKPAPMLQAVVDASTNFFKNPNQVKPLDVIVTFCKICIGILSTDLRTKFHRAGTIGLVQRVMVATALLYDHLSDTGLFVKDSPINVKQVVHILQLEAGLPIRRHGSFGSKDNILDDKIQNVDRTIIKEVQGQAKNLLNVLKYSNKHLKDETTSKSVEAMFAKIM